MITATPTSTQPSLGTVTKAMCWLFAVASIGAASGLVMMSTSKYGPAVSPDSVVYFIQADAISSDGLGALFSSAPAEQPSLYPFTLSVISHLAYGQALTASRIVNVLCAAVLTGLVLFNLRTLNRLPMAIGTAMAVLSLPLSHVYAAAWSESLFIVLVYTTLSFRLVSPLRVSALVGVAAITGAAFLTRYAGIVLIPTVVAIILFGPGGKWLRKGVDAALYTLMASVPIAVNLARNYLLQGMVTGQRAPSTRSFLDNAELTSMTLIDWFMPSAGMEPTGNATRLAFVIVLLLGSYIFVRLVLSDSRNRAWRQIRVVLFVVIYLGFLIWTSSYANYDRIGARLLSPIYPAVAMLVAYGIDLVQRHTASLRLGRVRWMRIGIVLVAFLILLPGNRVVRQVAAQRQGGAGGFNHDQWRTSPFIAYLQSNRHEFPHLHCNAPLALYFLTGIISLPIPRVPSGEALPSAHELLKGSPTLEEGTVAWFHQMTRPGVLTPQQLGMIFEKHVISTFEDGILFTTKTPE